MTRRFQFRVRTLFALPAALHRASPRTFDRVVNRLVAGDNTDRCTLTFWCKSRVRCVENGQWNFS
ncbi:MAG TPA: hypothetical protein VHC22_10805 [Pirellulales bacterium]|nr:hypothetical protein [Pirellulales bacterium]